ncbi:hypothetical protein [Desulfopila sp. IMCC35008]|uniref:hypothetical protein n=1 Tax=Desulfopila sp. IMCC35008 TaxID=2653858 RepID=UPI0013D2313A|nr:hypothetical protein [Desulfopila sp. IMCC35008]
MSCDFIKFTRVVVTTATVVFLTVGQGYSADYQSMTTEELSDIRGSLYNASQDERDAFHAEWNKRLDSMSAEERAQFAASGPGRGKGLQDGSGAGRQGGAGEGLGKGNGNRGGDGTGNGGGRGNGGGQGGNGGGKGGGKGRK